MTASIGDVLRSVGKLIFITIFGGYLCGTAIGLVPILLYFHTISLDCNQYPVSSCPATTCEVVAFSDSVQRCTFSSLQNPCVANWTSNQCTKALGGGRCRVDSVFGCTINPGWTAFETGLFAGSLILGGMVGAASSSTLLRLVPRQELALQILSIVSVVGTACGLLAVGIDSFAAFLISRLILGVAVGWTHVLCPLLVNERTRAEYKGTVSAIFQSCFAIGITLQGLIGVLMDVEKGADHVTLKMAFIHIPSLVCGVGLFACGRFIAAGPAELHRNLMDPTAPSGAPTAPPSRIVHAGLKDVFKKENIRCFLAAIGLSAAQQLTGINAVMSYAPSMTASMGLSAMLSNFLVMLWNALFTLVALVVSRRFAVRRMYLMSLAAVTTFLPLVGIATHPGITGTPAGVDEPGWSNALVAIGLAGYVAAFELGMGPGFWALASELFPTPLRSIGSSFTNTVQLTFAMLLVVGYPSVCQAFIGASGDPREGLASVIFMFTAIAAMAWLFLWKELHPHTGDSEVYVPIVDTEMGNAAPRSREETTSAAPPTSSTSDADSHSDSSPRVAVDVKSEDDA